MLPTGHLVYARAGSLMAAPFDLVRLAVTGPPVPVVEHVLMHAPSGAAQFALSRNGVLVYFAAGEENDRAMVWVDRRGGGKPLTDTAGFNLPRLSPDDRQVVFGGGAGRTDLWVYQLARGTSTRLTFEQSMSGRSGPRTGVGSPFPPRGQDR